MCIFLEGSEKMKSKKDLEKQFDELLKIAQRLGLDGNPFFASALDRYITQMRILNRLEREVEKTGATVTKEYVKNRANIYINPAVTEYNKTATAANNTLAALMNVMKTFAEEKNACDIGEMMSKLMKDE